MASGFFSRFISRFNSFCSPLALSILLSFLNYVYNFTFPKVTNILVLGSFSIKRRVFDPLCKTRLTCFTSPLCNLSAEQQINIQVITASLLKSWSNQFKLKYNFWYYTVLLPTLIYQNIYIYMSDAERWSQKSGLLICIIIFEHFLIRDAFCISIDDFQLHWYVCSVFVINKLLEYFCTWLCEYVFTCTKKALLQRFQRMSCVCLFLVISYSSKILGNRGFLRVCFTTLFYSGLHLHTGMEEHCQNTYLWFLDKCSCSVCQWRALPILFSSIFSATDWYVYANRYVDELFSSHSKHLQWGLSSTDIEW